MRAKTHSSWLRHLQRASELRKAHLGLDNPDTRDSIQALACAYQWSTRHAEAIALRQQLLDYAEARFGSDNPETLTRMSALAESLTHAGQLPKGALLREQLLKKRQAIWGPAHSITLDAMTHLAWVYGNMDRFAESIELYERFLALRTSKNHPEQDHPHALTLFALVCLWAGKTDRAESLLRDTIDFHQRQRDSWGRRIDLGNAYGLLALVQIQRERYDEAEELARKALAFDQTPQRQPYWLSVQGAALLGQGKYAAAEPLLLQGYQGMKEWVAGQRARMKRLSQVCGWIVSLYEATDQPEKARQWREKLQPLPADASFLK